MELVAGEPITSYCDREQLDIRRRQPPSISWHAFDTTPKTAISDTLRWQCPLQRQELIPRRPHIRLLEGRLITPLVDKRTARRMAHRQGAEPLH